jgi:hypothetical protein
VPPFASAVGFPFLGKQWPRGAPAERSAAASSSLCVGTGTGTGRTSYVVATRTWNGSAAAGLERFERF